MESNLKQIFSALEPQITPLTDTLLYSYDYGDGWCVRVSCTEGYYINDSWDHLNEKGCVHEIADSTMIADDKKFQRIWISLLIQPMLRFQEIMQNCYRIR